MKSLIQYIYYRLTKFYKNTFGIEDSPGFLIQSCYDWGSQILTSIVCFYILAIETIILQFLGIRMKTSYHSSFCISSLKMSLVMKKSFLQNWIKNSKETSTQL